MDRGEYVFDAGLSASIAEVMELFQQAQVRLKELAAAIPQAAEETSLEDIEGTPDPRTLVRASLLSVALSIAVQLPVLERAWQISEGRG